MLYEPPPQQQPEFNWIWAKWIYGLWEKFVKPYPLLAGETGVVNYEYRVFDLRRISTGSGTSADPYVIDDTALQNIVDTYDNIKIKYGDGGFWKQGKITVTTTGRGTLFGPSTYLWGALIDARGADIEWNGASSTQFWDIQGVSGWTLLGGYWHGSPTNSFFRVKGTATNPARYFKIMVDRIKGGGSSGNGSDIWGIVLDGTDGNTAGFYIGGYTQITHIRDGIYFKNGAPGSGVDTGIVENISTWPYGSTSADAGYGIRVEAAVDVTFRRIYAGVFEQNQQATIYLKPQLTDGIRNCIFENIGMDVSGGETDCYTIRGFANDSNKPIVGNSFRTIKMNNAPTAVDGSFAIYMTTSGGAEIKRNSFEGISTNDTTVKTITLGSGSDYNTIIPSGDIELGSISTYVTDNGHRNVIVGQNIPILTADNIRDTGTAANDNTLKTYSIPADTLDLNDGIIVNARGWVNVNANGMDLKIVLGTTTVATYTVGAATTGRYEIKVEIYNQADKASQRVFSKMIVGTTVVQNTSSASTEDFATALDIKHIVTPNAVPAGDTVYGDLWNVEIMTQPL